MHAKAAVLKVKIAHGEKEEEENNKKTYLYTRLTVGNFNYLAHMPHWEKIQIFLNWP